MKSVKAIKIPHEIKKIGFFSDLHGNDYNLSHMFNKHPEIEYWFCVGDAIDMFGPMWNNLPTLRKMYMKGVISIIGNHETAVLTNNNKLRDYAEEQKLLEYLQQMPFSLSIQFGNLKIKVFHATPKSVNEYLDPESPEQLFSHTFGEQDCDIVIVGHTHKKYLKELDSLQIINPGSLGLDDFSYCTINNEGDTTFNTLDIG